MQIIKFGGSVIDDEDKIELLAQEILMPNRLIIISAAKDLSRAIKEAISNAVTSHTVKGFLERYEELIFRLTGNNPNKTDLTDSLLMMKRLLRGISMTKEADPGIIDILLCEGEKTTASLVMQYMDRIGKQYTHFDASKYFITSSDHGSAIPLIDRIRQNIEPLLLDVSNKPIITEGFIGVDPDGRPTTMGFESSNLTAMVMAEIAGVSAIEYISKMPGIYSTDPESYYAAIPVKTLNIYDAKFLASSGTRILHAESLQFADRNGLSLKYCDLELRCNTLINKSIESSYPIVASTSSMADRAIGSDHHNTITIMLPPQYKMLSSQIISILENKTITAGTEIVPETKSRILRMQIENLTVDDLDRIHEIFNTKDQ